MGPRGGGRLEAGAGTFAVRAAAEVIGRLFVRILMDFEPLAELLFARGRRPERVVVVVARSKGGRDQRLDDGREERREDGSAEAATGPAAARVTAAVVAVGSVVAARAVGRSGASSRRAAVGAAAPAAGAEDEDQRERDRRKSWTHGRAFSKARS